MEKYYKKTITFYDKNVEEYIKKTDKLQNVKWLKRFIKLLPPKAKVLDLGCGYGRDCKFFVKKGLETYGVDLSKRMIDRARKTVRGAKFLRMDLLNLNFPNNFFDAIWCSAVLIHISKKDIDKAFFKIKNVLKKNGIIYLNMKEGKGEGLTADKRYHNFKKFYSYYTKQQIKNLLRKHGFKIKYFDSIKPKGYRFTGTIFVIAENSENQ